MVLEAIHNDGLKVLIRTNMVKDYFSYREQLVIGQFFTIISENKLKYNIYIILESLALIPQLFLGHYNMCIMSLEGGQGGK